MTKNTPSEDSIPGLIYSLIGYHQTSLNRSGSDHVQPIIYTETYYAPSWEMAFTSSSTSRKLKRSSS